MTSRKGIGGPKTPDGKRKSSLNALKHGYYAQSQQGMAAVAEAIGMTYNDVLEEMLYHFDPVDPIERMLVVRIARCWWRFLYTQAVEDRAIESSGFLMPSSNGERITRQERLTDIQFHRALEAFERRRALRPKSRRYELPEHLFPSVAHTQREREFVPSETNTAASAESPE